MMKTSTPEKQGISSVSLKNLIERLEEHKIPVHSILVARHGNLVMEAYYKPYTREKLHRMFSQTKSYTSLGIGLLAAEGTISLKDKICSYFPGFLPGKVHPWMEEMTIEDLLKMETCHNMTTYNKTSTTENWVRSFFQTIPTHRPGTVFMYDTSASHTLCALVEKLTGQKLLDFLKDRFLREIGFSEESYIMPDPFGVSMGGTGLMAKPRDMMLVALMLLNGGRDPKDYGNRDGKQVYPEMYLKAALDFQTPTCMSALREWGYGYQFWRLPFHGFAMLGMGSQNTMCFPEQDLAVVINADTQGIPNGSDMILNDLITELIEKLSDGPIEENEQAVRDQKELNQLLETLTLPVLKNSTEHTMQDAVSGKNYYFWPNKDGFKRMSLTFRENGGVLEYENERGMHQIPFGTGDLVESVFPEYGQKCVSSGAWYDEDTFCVCCWLTDESVAAVHFKFICDKDGTLTLLMKKTEETKFNEFQGILTAVME